MSEGFIKLDRKILDWEWYGDINTCRLFIHMLLKANWKEGRFLGECIPRGSFAASYDMLSKETGLSIRTVRTAVKHLKATGEVTTRALPKFTVFSIKNYCDYQYSDKVNDSQTTNERQAIDKEATNNRQAVDKEATNERQAIDKETTDNRQANDRQTTTIEERKKERKEEEKEKKEEKEKTGAQSALTPYGFSQSLENKIMEWLAYKTERKENYRQTGLTALLRKISQKVGQFGEKPVIELIDECMANGWRGIIWDRLDTGKENKKENKEDENGWNEYLKDGLYI